MRFEIFLSLQRAGRWFVNCEYMYTVLVITQCTSCSLLVIILLCQDTVRVKGRYTASGEILACIYEIVVIHECSCCHGARYVRVYKLPDFDVDVVFTFMFFLVCGNHNYPSE